VTNQKTETEGTSHICSNPKCHKSFESPILVQDLGSIEKQAPYYACPSCLTRFQVTTEPDANEEEPKARQRRIRKQQEKPEATQQTSTETITCSHHLGYLSHRPKTEKMPEECLTCPKILECMLSELKGKSATQEKAPKQIVAEEVAEETSEQPVEDEQIEAEEPDAETEEVPAELSRNEFRVEDLGMMHKSWSNTVRIHKHTLSSWGKKIKEVEIETFEGKKKRCKVKPMDESKETVEIPSKLQSKLKIQKGQIVKVRPIIEQNE
jgi:hypothetical protein